MTSDNIPPVTGEASPPTVHGFSRKFAQRYGVKEAIVMRYLGNRIRNTTNVRDKKPWFYDSITKISRRFPYMGRQTVANVLNSLIQKNLLTVGNYNRRKKDKTRWYSASVPVLDSIEEDIVTFDVQVAVDDGICAGCIMVHLRYLHGKKPEWPVNFSATEYARKMPFTIDEIRSALDRLIARRRIRRDNASTGQYFVCRPSRYKVVDGRIIAK